MGVEHALPRHLRGQYWALCYDSRTDCTSCPSMAVHDRDDSLYQCSCTNSSQRTFPGKLVACGMSVSKSTLGVLITIAGAIDVFTCAECTPQIEGPCGTPAPCVVAWGVDTIIFATRVIGLQRQDQPFGLQAYRGSAAANSARAPREGGC